MPSAESDAVVAFDEACELDSTGHRTGRRRCTRRRSASGDLDPYRRRRATIQLASSLRNLGQPERALELIAPEAARQSDELDDAVAVFHALVLADLGREREGLALVLQALAPHLPRYQNSATNYARDL